MSTNHSQEAESRQLLDLFVQETRRRLRAEVLAALKLDIDKAMDDAVAELKPQIESYYDNRRGGMVHHLLVSRRGERA